MGCNVQSRTTQCLDYGLPIKHEPLSRVRSNPCQLGFLERRCRRTDGRVWVELFPSEVLWSVGAPKLCHAQLASSFSTGSLSAETIVDYPVSLRNGIFPRGLSPPGSLMGATSSAPVAVARVTTVCPLSQCTLVPLGCLLRDLQPSNGEGHEPPESRSTVGCKPGHDSPWDTITETSVKGSDAINPQGWEKGSLSETPHFCGSPFC